MRILPICLATVTLFQSSPASASISQSISGVMGSIFNWIAPNTRTWEFMQSVGGITVGEPTRNANGEVSLPVQCDVSGLTTITHKPTGLNSALIVWRISQKIKGNEVYLAVKTGVYDNKSSRVCGSVMLGDLPAGQYKIYYQGPESQKHFLAEVKVP